MKELLDTRNQLLIHYLETLGEKKNAYNLILL